AAGSGGPIIDLGSISGGDDPAAKADAFEANWAGAGAGVAVGAGSGLAAATSPRGFFVACGAGGARATGATGGGGGWLGGDAVCWMGGTGCALACGIAPRFDVGEGAGDGSAATGAELGAAGDGGGEVCLAIAPVTESRPCSSTVTRE